MALAYIQPIQLTPAAAGGTVRVFLAGSTDAAPTYNPVTGELNYNPLSIDSAGYCEAFLVDTANSYDLKVFKANGSLYLTRENLAPLGGGSGAPGPQGPRGIRGEKGDKGDTGAAGQDGTNGVDGEDGADGADGISLVSILVDQESDYGRIIYNKSDNVNTWYEAGNIVPDGVGKVKVSSSDAAGFLENKVTSGTNISVVSNSQKLTINNTAPETFKTQASPYSTVKDFLNAIIEGTSGVTVSTSADFNKIIISGAGIGGSGFTPKGEWNNTTTYVEGDGVWYYDDTVSPVINRYYVASATNTNSNPYTVGTGWVIMFSIDQLGDQMVKLDASDSTTSFLLDKIKAGDGIVFTRTVDAGGDYITVSGQQVFTVTTTNGSRTINDLSHDIKFREGVWTRPLYVGNEIAIDHLNVIENASNTSVMYTATGLPKFDDYGHFKNECDPIEISDVSGLEGAITAAGDGKVSVNAGDTKGYLASKITAGSGVQVDNQGDRIVISSSITESSSFFFKSNYNNANNSGYVAIDQVIFGNQYIDAPNHRIHNLPAGKLLLSTNLKAVSDFGAFDYSEDCYSGSTGTQTYIIGENNPLVKFNSTPFGNWTGYQSKYTGYNEPPYWYGYTRRVVKVAGKQLVNLGCNLYSRQNSNGGVTLYLKHYSSLGDLKTTYQVNEGDWTNLNYQEPSLAQYRQLTKSLVIDCAEFDYFSVEIRVRGEAPNNSDIRSGTHVTDITLNGALLSGNQYNFPIAQVNTFVTQYSSTGSVKNYYDHKYAFSEYTNESSCKTYLIDMAVGDYIVLTYNAGNYVADVQYEVHGTTCVGAKGDKGDKGDTGTAGEATLDGLLTFPIILSNSNISTGHTSEQGVTYASSRVIAAASVEANFMSCFFTQVGTFYGLRMGIYLPGPAGDTLIAQTEVLTNTPSLGICTMPLTRDGAGNLLTDHLYLDPNTSYMPAIIIKANATNMAAYEGISTNPPNHFGRYDSWNAPAPTNLMPLTAAFSQSNTFPWLAISK